MTPDAAIPSSAVPTATTFSALRNSTVGAPATPRSRIVGSPYGRAGANSGLVGGSSPDVQRQRRARPGHWRVYVRLLSVPAFVRWSVPSGCRLISLAAPGEQEER